MQKILRSYKPKGYSEQVARELSRELGIDGSKENGKKICLFIDLFLGDKKK